MMVGLRLGIDWIKWSEEINLKKVCGKGITIRANPSLKIGLVNKPFLFCYWQRLNKYSFFEYFFFVFQDRKLKLSAFVWKKDFVKPHKIYFETDAESFSFLSCKTKKFYSERKYFLNRCQYQNKKGLFTDPIFSEGFEHRF